MHETRKKYTVLLLSAPIGSGHRLAAEALEQALADRPEVEVIHGNIFDFFPQFLGKVFLGTYLWILKCCPWLYKLAYSWGNKQGGSLWMRELLNRLLAWLGGSYLRSVQPDAVIATHATPAGIIGYYKKQHPKLWLGAVVTDFTIHRWWVCDGVDTYFTADELLRDKLATDADIQATGIPVRQQFMIKHDKQKCREFFGWDETERVCLLMGGLWMSRLLKHNLMEDVFNTENESFMQETRLLENDYSVNLPTRFYYRKRWNRGWINVVNPFRASIVLGTPGSGKSMSCKREITFIILTTKDNVIICDPEDEYSPLVRRLGGQVIRLSPSSTDYVNPLDINLNYSDEENPLALKSDFVLSFCELIMGSKTGLEAIEKTVIDRAVQKIYQPYFADPRPENMPILGDLKEALLAQGIPEADRVAQALDLYVNGSLNFFNHRTTVDIRNRLVCFDIKGLGKNLKKPGMLIVQDAVWNTVTINRAIGRSTWYFVDEFHLLLKEEQTAAYSAEIWKRFRKWGGVPTGATQNPKDLLSSPEIENILENSDFIYMLNQAAGDRKILAERLGISAEQLAYVTNSEPGHGLLFFNNVILPFADDFPKDTELYKLLTTKPSEVEHAAETEE